MTPPSGSIDAAAEIARDVNSKLCTTKVAPIAIRDSCHLTIAFLFFRRIKKWEKKEFATSICFGNGAKSCKVNCTISNGFLMIFLLFCSAAELWWALAWNLFRLRQEGLHLTLEPLHFVEKLLDSLLALINFFLHPKAVPKKLSHSTRCPRTVLVKYAKINCFLAMPFQELILIFRYFRIGKLFPSGWFLPFCENKQTHNWRALALRASPSTRKIESLGCSAEHKTLARSWLYCSRSRGNIPPATAFGYLPGNTFCPLHPRRNSVWMLFT